MEKRTDVGFITSQTWRKVVLTSVRHSLLGLFQSLKNRHVKSSPRKTIKESVIFLQMRTHTYLLDEEAAPVFVSLPLKFSHNDTR